jgi:membrane-bound lytic murein transglycosylase B
MSKLQLFTLLLIATTACAHADRTKDTPPPSIVLDLSTDPQTAIEDVDHRLKSAGVSERDINLIHQNYINGKKKWFDSAIKIMEPNLFGFLYHGDYFSHDTPSARKKISQYLRAHQHSFKTSEKKFKVRAKSIAALLWVETKLGKATGNFPLPWVYYSIALTSHPRFCSEMLKIVPEKIEKSSLPEKPDFSTAQNKILDRCRTKSEWAIEELKALFQLEKTHGFKPFQIKGSFAGAFGIPQFLPSSYKKYAVSSFRKRPDLFLISDAILSVGRFLSSNGWKDETPESHLAALYSYNRSKDYGTVITQIAREL